MRITRELLSTSEVARRLACSDARVVQLANSGLLPPALITSIGRLFDAETVERYRRERGGTARSRRRTAEKKGTQDV